jgi:hypothetical protein
MRGGSARELKKVDALLRWAIAERRLVAFRLHGLARIAEPHDYGEIGGVRRLFFYQVGGESRSGAPLGWRWADVGDLAGLQLLDATFDGPRAGRTGRHVKWDTLHATVSPRRAAESPGKAAAAPRAKRRR